MVWTSAKKHFNCFLLLWAPSITREPVGGYERSHNQACTRPTSRRNIEPRRIAKRLKGCVPLGWSGSGSVIQDLSGSRCIKGTGESMIIVDTPVPLMHHDPDRSWITDPDPDHPRKGTQPIILMSTSPCWQSLKLVSPAYSMGMIYLIGLHNLNLARCGRSYWSKIKSKNQWKWNFNCYRNHHFTKEECELLFLPVWPVDSYCVLLFGS